LFFILVIFVFNGIFISENDFRQLDKEKSTIVCNPNKNSKKEFKKFSLSSLEINIDQRYFVNNQFDYKYYFTNSNEYNIKNIFEACFSDNKTLLESLIKSDVDVYDVQKKLEIQTRYDFWKNDQGGYSDSNDKDVSDSLKVNTANDEMNKYDSTVSGVYGVDKSKFLDFSATVFEISPVFSYTFFIKYFLLGNVSILFIFEVIKRIFYYIALGTLKPKRS
jgi:hypothetical protein